MTQNIHIRSALSSHAPHRVHALKCSGLLSLRGLEINAQLFLLLRAKLLLCSAILECDRDAMDVSGCVPDVTFWNTEPLKIQRGNNGPLTNGL
jgi:hypothetical protein